MRHAPRVAIACCRARGDAAPEDLFPDPDSELLVRALAGVGVAAGMLAWDDPGVAWEAKDLVVIRSTWDSVDRPVEYLRWARRVDRVSTLVNSAQVLSWNLDKTYLADLVDLGLPVVPTRFVWPGATWEPPEGEFVLKPSVSAGGRETARYGPAHRRAARDHMARLLAAGRTAMVQPYLPAVTDPGEISLVFIDGAYSHSVRKGPVLEIGAGVQDRPWEKMVYLGLTEPSAAEVAVARRTQAGLEERFGPLVYSRVDLLAGPSGGPMVLEVELIDPYLSLSLSSMAPTRLASAIAGRLASSPMAGTR